MGNGGWDNGGWWMGIISTIHYQTISNFSPSKSPRSLIFSCGITSNAINDKVMKGEVSVLPRDLAFWSRNLYFSATTDRKSTRLNSSHVAISYAVFCLKINK